MSLVLSIALLSTGQLNCQSGQCALPTQTYVIKQPARLGWRSYATVTYNQPVIGYEASDVGTQPTVGDMKHENNILQQQNEDLREQIRVLRADVTALRNQRVVTTKTKLVMPHGIFIRLR